MANYTIADDEIAAHKTLATGVVDEVTFEVNDNEITVFNRSTSDDIWFSVDGTTPAAANGHCYVVTAARRELTVPTPGAADVVKLIAAGNAAYSVTRTR